MEKLFLLFLFFHVSSPVKHFLRFSLTGSSGIPKFPEFMATLDVDDSSVGYCDTNRKKVEPRQEWGKKLFEADPQHLEYCKARCFEDQPNFFKITMNDLKQLFNQTGGVHILQRMDVYEWDDETGEVSGFMQYGYDGEDILSFDLKTETWIALKPEAETIKRRWDADKAKIKEDEIYLTQILPEFLKKYVALANSSLLRKDLPSVSLLQQTPSSPVRCFASGFYPERASLFWRKDGDDLHEDVEHGEILPNTDGTFQMSVDLKVSSVTPEDWRRYECVFQLSGVKDDIVTKLDKAVIKTNYETPSNTAAITAAVVVVALVVLIVVVIAVGCMIKKKKEDSKSKPSTEPSGVSAQGKDIMEKDSGSTPSISSEGSEDSSTPLVNNFGSSPSISSTESGDSSTPLVDNRGSNKK